MVDITKAMAAFDLSETAELNCGTFDIVIRQAAAHNTAFKAAVQKKALKAKKKSLAVVQGTVTGSEETDQELLIETVIVGWGERPLCDDAGNPVPFSAEVLMAMFATKPGKVLYSKIMEAAMRDDTFSIAQVDVGNSSGSSAS